MYGLVGFSVCIIKLGMHDPLCPALFLLKEIGYSIAYQHISRREVQHHQDLMLESSFMSGSGDLVARDRLFHHQWQSHRQGSRKMFLQLMFFGISWFEVSSFDFSCSWNKGIWNLDVLQMKAFDFIAILQINGLCSWVL